MRKSLINRRAAKAADSMHRRSGIFARMEQSAPPAPIAPARAEEASPDSGCPEYIAEQDNPYPLCDNRDCPDTKACCRSAHMSEAAYTNHDKGGHRADG